MANETELSYPSAFCQQFFNRNGKPLAAGRLYTYKAGSNEPAVTYKTIDDTSSAANRNTNPIILDNAGYARLVIEIGKSYKFVLCDRHDTKIMEWDDVTAGGGSGGGGDISNKKDKQQNIDISSTETKTLTRITQNKNGVIDTHFDDIDYTPANRNIAPEYSPSETYPIIGTLRMHDGVLYRNKVAINTTEDWTEAHWETAIVSDELIKKISYLDVAENYDEQKEYYKFDLVIYNDKLYMANYFSNGGSFDSNKWDEVSLFDVNKYYSLNLSRNYNQIQYNYSTISYNPFVKNFIGNLNFRTSNSFSRGTWVKLFGTNDGEGPNIYGATKGVSLGNTSYSTTLDTQIDDNGAMFIRMLPNDSSSYGVDTVPIIGYHG